MVAAKKPDLVVFIPGGGGDSHIKVTGMLVFSLWGVNCRFWSHLGCLGRKVTIYLPIQVSLRAVLKEIYKKCVDTDHTEIVSLRGLI